MSAANSPKAVILIHVFIDLSFLMLKLHFDLFILVLMCFFAPLIF